MHGRCACSRPVGGRRLPRLAWLAPARCTRADRRGSTARAKAAARPQPQVLRALGPAILRPPSAEAGRSICLPAGAAHQVGPSGGGRPGPLRGGADLPTNCAGCVAGRGCRAPARAPAWTLGLAGARFCVGRCKGRCGCEQHGTWVAHRLSVPLWVPAQRHMHAWPLGMQGI